MLSRRHLVVLVVVAVVLTLFGGSSASADQAQRPARETVPGRYIVVLDDAVGDVPAATRAIERSHGITARHRYSHAIKGFSASLNEGQVRALQRRPDVAAVVADGVVHATGDLVAGETAPNSVKRIQAASTTTARAASGVNVAVIDSGVDLDHPDLVVRNGVNCVTPGPADDDEGHGTHVAGSIAARNTGSGVVGVAPGTTIYAVKALDANGDGTWAQILCGLDWVTATRTDPDPTNDIAVANMSLGGSGSRVATCATTTDPFHQGVCRATAAGVTLVVAAGNSGWDYDYAPVPDVPAAYPEVLTVSSIADADGAPGGVGGTPTCDTRQSDDRYSTFSNYASTSAGAAHLIAAPGSCVLSTVPGGGYGTNSGTSMASPHVAGLVALCMSEGGVAGPCAGAAPAEVIRTIRTTAAEHAAAAPSYGFTGDPQRPVSGRAYGHLAWAAPAPSAPVTEDPPVVDEPTPPQDTTPPTVSAFDPANGATAVATATAIRVTFSEAMDPGAAAALTVTRTTDGAGVTGATSWSGNVLTFSPAVALAGGTSYYVHVAATAADASGNAMGQPAQATFTTLRTVSQSPTSVAMETGSLSAGGVSSLSANDNAFLDVRSTTSGQRRTSWHGRTSGVPNNLLSLRVAYAGLHTRTCTQTLAIYRWTTGSWVTLDSRSVGTTEVTLDRAPAGALADYVSNTSGTGEVRVRVACVTSSASYTSRSDQLRLTYTAP